MSVEAFHESVKDVEVSAEAARPLGVVGAMLSAGAGAGVVVVSAGVVTDKGADGAETLPAASKAAMVKAHVLPAKRSVMSTEVLVEGNSSVPLQYTR